MRNISIVAFLVFALIGGAESFVRRKDVGIINVRECSPEGTLRTFRFSDARNTPLFCECLPGFDGRYCEKRICKNGSVQIVDVFDSESSESYFSDVATKTICKCNKGFRGLTCEDKVERKPVPWTTVLAFLEPIFFFIIFMIPCCCALQMAREFAAPLFNREAYSLMYYDNEQGMGLPSKPVPIFPGRCPYSDSAPPAYTNIYSNPLPTVSPMTDLRQPIYGEAKIYPHV